MWFPIDTVAAKIVNGFYEVDFDPDGNSDRVCQWLTILGPAGSAVNVYLDTIFVDTTARGDFNRADYYKGIPIARGRQLRLVWNVGTGTPVPTASMGSTDGREEVSNGQSGNAGIFTY